MTNRIDMLDRSRKYPANGMASEIRGFRAPNHWTAKDEGLSLGATRKREKFVELAEARVNRALKELQLIGNLSNRSAYEFEEADVRKIFSALQKALDSAKGRFSKESEGGKGEFKL